MARRPLRSGYTTGACAAAAARGAALMLHRQQVVSAVEIALPAGFTARFELHGQVFDDRSARCFVVKDAGDDPDVTHGAAVHAELVREVRGAAALAIEGGPGIGRVTKPGLPVAVGEWAINPVPRRMIEEAVAAVFPRTEDLCALRVTLSIPDGEVRARRTLNARLGILGGLSILGTTGVVRPVSHRAWTDTLEVALDVALAAPSRLVVLSTGRTSEAGAQAFLAGGGAVRAEGPGPPEEAFVMMGDHVGYALRACHRKGVTQVLLATQFAKLLKIACGHPQTHASASRLDLGQLAAWARQAGLDGALAGELECANTARQVWERVGPEHPLVGEVGARALERLAQWGAGVRIGILLVGYDDRPPVLFGEMPAAREDDRP